jgi:hypothetical protein
MATFTYRSEVPVPPERLWEWLKRPGALARLAPPWEHPSGWPDRLPDSPGVVTLTTRALGRRWRLSGSLEPCPERSGFALRLSGFPLGELRLECRHEATKGGMCLCEDVVSLVPPGGTLGRWVLEPTARRRLRRLLTHAHETLRNDLLRHREGPGPMRILVAGSSGLIGRHLVAFLRAGGHEVFRLVRRRATAPDEIPWDPARGELDAPAVEGMDAWIHLGGENIAAGRWNARRRRAILESRVRSTRLLAETLARLDQPPRVFLCASAVGYYGDRGAEPVDESCGPGRGFLAEVCQRWEEAAQAARRAGVRVVHGRIGMVLSGAGGALARMLPAFRLGLGGRIGSGRQYVSWIAMDDLLGALLHCLGEERLEGPVNLVAPRPVPQAVFASTLARLLGRPAVLPLPAPVVRALFGEMGRELLLAGVRALPVALERTRFAFFYPDLAAALRRELGLEARRERRAESV